MGARLVGGRSVVRRGSEAKTAIADTEVLSILKSILTQILLANTYLSRIVTEELKEEDTEKGDF